MTHARSRDQLRAWTRRILLQGLWFLPWWTGVWLVVAFPSWIHAVWTGGAGPGMVLGAIGAASAAVVLHRLLRTTYSRLAFGLTGVLLVAVASGTGAMVLSLARLPDRPDVLLAVTAIAWTVLIGAGTAAAAFAVLPEATADDE